jgi:hypothetical protein
MAKFVMRKKSTQTGVDSNSQIYEIAHHLTTCKNLSSTEMLYSALRITPRETYPGTKTAIILFNHTGMPRATGSTGSLNGSASLIFITRFSNFFMKQSEKEKKKTQNKKLFTSN